MLPFHIWLPEAHVEAPTSGPMILAGILLKLGYYGFVRFFLAMFPSANLFFSPFISSLCIIGCLYGALLALSQTDIKKIIAYSSISHMNLCILGVFSFDLNSLVGSYILAIGHGIVSTALFFLVGCLYERYHTRIIDYYSGLSYLLPVFSIVFFYFIISNFAFPISINFIAEFLLFLGIFK
jgi:NADH:ubiquinone oxidoreductase subunit 4 (subunit M)